ncbi:breast cancer type 2 susceptibility protein [Micropterus dolomieu]|uniref:breast cancer type 2 susceptibility protein n=1 Tax=Micropterus dolomieu TaxID=147949 RepID=UPI001E8E7D29|nr:breast cancer type 2 susceptibility protein [Micropterus dolomieu]
MDLPSKNMYDTFKHEIWRDLGPLDPDWFEALTAQTVTNEGSVSDQDELCANQEGNFKTPFDKTTVDSQLFSTPKVFRHCRVVSPETEDEHSFTAEHEKQTMPWTVTQSPCLFPGVPGAKYGGIQPYSQDSFDLLHTPQKSPVSHAKLISESLGAQIHPDMSWTSSLNTPSAVPSTLILSKTDESPCPVSVSADKNVVFVRKLFPSLSNASEVVSPKNNDMPTFHQGVVSPEAGQNPEPHDSPQSSLNQSDSVWRQKLPDTTEEGEIRSTIAGVLDGAENVLSIFFTSSSSALRKVKTDRIKRKQIIPTIEHGCSSTEISTANNDASSEQRTADQEHGRFPSSPPVKTGEYGITQWSPLSLSDIPPSTVDTCHDNSLTRQVDNNIIPGQLWNDTSFGQLRPPVKISDSGFTKRKFVYTVDSLKLQVQGKETQSQKMDSSPRIPDSGQEVYMRQLGKAPDEADCCSIRKNEMEKQGNLAEENLPPSVQAKVQDLDMSQLCRDFAQDFSQMSDPGKLSKVAEDTPRNGFCPSACLSAMKREKQKARQANLHHDCDGVSNRRNVSATNTSINEGTTSDSGFHSADITHMTASSFVLSSENNRQQWTGFKTDIHKTTPFQSTNKRNGKPHSDDILQEAKTDAKLSTAIKKSQTLGPGKENELHIECTSAQLSSNAKGTVNNINCIPLNGQADGSLPEKTVSLPYVHASGFKTASNKRIPISSANLERAKRLLEETEGERTSSDQHIKCAPDSKAKISSHGSVKNTSNSNQPPTSSEKCVDISYQLTASQKADVTELCTLMEEADSQFEFTQFKTAKLKQHCQDNTTSPKKVDKELDPDFLTGIDFDDSFSSDAEKHLAVTDKMTLDSDGKTNCETANIKSTGFSVSSAMKQENPSAEDVSSSSNHISECSHSMMSAGPIETSKVENNNPLMLGAGFKTAGGNVLRVSKKCLSKAKALFADLEEDLVTSKKLLDKQSSESDAKTQQRHSVDNHAGNLLHHKEDKWKFRGYDNNTRGMIQGCFSNKKESVCSVRPVKGIRDEDTTKCLKNVKMDTTTCQSGFQMANGKGISISTKAMQESDAFFKDCDVIDSNAGISGKHKSMEPLPGSVSHKKNLVKFKNVQGMKVNFSEEPVNEPDVEVHNLAFKNAPTLMTAASFHGNPSSTAKAFSSPSCTTSKNIGSSINELSNSGGFCTASGKKVSISADALKQAEGVLNEIHTLEETNKQVKKKGDSLKTGHLTNQIWVSPHKNSGFQTASGKGVTISSAALKKAKTLLSECEGADEDKIGVGPTHSKLPIHGPPPRDSGFLAASGRPLAFSSEALQKAKALFRDISFSTEGSPVSDTRNSDKTQDNAENTERMHCGFSTAGGTKVHVSQKNLLKAKHILKEVDDADTSFRDSYIMDGNNGMSVKRKESIAPVSGTGSEKKIFSKFKPHQKVTNILEEPRSGHTEFENVNIGTVLTHEKMLPLNVEINKDVFKNTPDSTETVSLHGDPSLMAKPLSSPLCTSKNIGASAISELNSGGGFCTASGKKVSVSDDAMTKAKSLLNESATFEDTNKQLKQKDDTLPPQNSGFQTASGKGVAISSAALKTEKTPLRECEGADEDKNGVGPTRSKLPVHVPPPKNGGFLAASGRPLAFSSEALQKAKALFSDISFSAEIPPVHSDVRNNPEKIHCGFSTAGGTKVHVSQKNLLKAKNLLNVFADGECHHSTSYSNPNDTDKSDLSKEKRSSDYNLTSASDKDMPTNESATQIVKSLTSLQETDHTNAFKFKELKITPLMVGKPHDSPGEELSGVLDYEINWTSSSDVSKVKRTERSSVLNFQSLNLRGCSETQERFLAQEALDCTMALLEDESLASQIPSMTSENLPLQDYPISGNRSVEEQKGRGKRLLEESNMTGQPPLKRRLLEEFDRTVDGPRGSTVHPEKSSPNGVMKDRRVFKYSVPLHPNITRPHWSGKNYVETTLQKTAPKQHLTPGDCRSAHSKKPAFVPPLFKNAKAESCKNTVLKDSIRTPSAFVPPFKKQRTIIQESSSKPQEEEGKHHHLLVTPINSNTYVPPTKKTQNTTAVTGHKSKDIQSVALTDTANDNLMHLQKVPVGCGSDSSATESSHVDNTLSRSQDMFQNLHNIGLARDMQDMRIRKKKRQTIRPIPGSLFLTKTSGVSRISLKAALNGRPPSRYTPEQLYRHGVHQHVCEITSGTAESLRFNLQQFIKQEAFLDGGGVQLADGGWLIPSNDGTAGKEEFYRALCDTPGVDPKLISEEWVYNHYRWIVWKQASMERSFPETMGSLCLTPEQVLLQLKYRYDTEVDHSCRPALRKIMEKDDTAAKTLVLCVCGVVSRGHSPKRQRFSDTKTPEGVDAKVENPSAVVWLTDGWYAIKALLDEPLTAMLHKGRLAVGGKLIIHGAQLVGSQDACSPLEAPDSLMLKICANSSRPARWDAKLGFHRDPRPYLLPVSCLYSNGGPVGCVDIIILRSYPIQWMERKLDGGVVFRSVRAEEKEARRYNSHKQKAMEILFAKIQAEFEKEEKSNNKPQRRRQTVSRQDIASLQDGEELYEAVGDDPAYLEVHLSEQQLETLHNYRRSLMEKKQAELQDRYQRAVENAENGEGGCPKRDVTPVWRLCFADSMDQPGSVYQLNLWRPSLDLQSLLKEGCRYKVYNLTTSDGKKHGGSSTVQLTGTNKTQFQDIQASPEWLLTRFQPRVSTSFVDLQNPEFQPLCGEVDLTGYVISIVDGQGSSPAFYLTDEKLNFVKVRCFSSLSQSGLEDVVKPCVLLALSNLQLRGQSTSPTSVVYAGDLTVFSTNPKEVHLQESLHQLRNLVQGQENFLLTAEEKLSHLVKCDGLSSISSPALQTRTPVSTMDRRRETRTSVSFQQPVRSLGSFTPVSRNPPAPNCSAEKDPSSLKRRRALDYLSRIPSPPPLSHLGSVASPCVNKTFNPPRRSETPSTLKTVQTPARKPVDLPMEDEWVNDEELAMIDTQALLDGDLL